MSAKKPEVSLDYLLNALVDMGFLKQAQVDEVRAQTLRKGGVVEWLMKHGRLTEWQVTKARAAQFGAEVIEDDKVVVAKNWRRRLPRSVGAKFFKERQVVPVQISAGGTRGVCKVALNDPSDLDTIDFLYHLTRMDIVVRVASRPAIKNALSKMRDRVGR
ncbi:MAG: hypothetical protein WCT25_03390 [Candidatus Paceibacterota bacterium]